MKLNLPKFNLRWLALAVVALIGLIAVMTIANSAMTQAQTPPANTAVVRRGTISASVNATGKVRSKQSARLSLPVSGIVQEIFREEGDLVNSGDAILALRADDATRRVRQAELNLQSRQLDLVRAKAAPRDEDIDIARANLRKATLTVAAAEAAYSANPSAQNDAYREAARADLEIARASFSRVTNGASKEELETLQNSVAIAQIELENARDVLTRTKLTTPYTATVTEITVREGELVGAYTPLANVADLSALEIAVDIDEIDVANVAVGQSVDVRLDAFPGEKFAGKLTRLFPAASTQRGSTVYSAIVDFDPRGLLVRLGMGANLRIQTSERKDVLIVPNRALKNVGTRKAVRIVSPGNPRDVIVEIGVTDGNETEIVSGVNEGDRIAVQ